MMQTPWAFVAGDVVLLDTTKELIHSALLSPTASGALVNGEALDKKADDEFSDEVSAAIVDWIAKRMSDYHKNFHDTQLMQVGWSCSLQYPQVLCASLTLTQFYELPLLPSWFSTLLISAMHGLHPVVISHAWSPTAPSIPLVNSCLVIYVHLSCSRT